MTAKVLEGRAAFEAITPADAADGVTQASSGPETRIGGVRERTWDRPKMTTFWI